MVNNSTKMRWSEEQTYQFVKIYQSHENLWNTEHEHHKTGIVRMKSYRSFIAELRDTTGIDLNIPELRIKIKTLRTTYLQELAKIKRRSDPTHTFKTSLKWFGEMHKCFINKHKQLQVSSIDFQDSNENASEDSSKVWVSPTRDCIYSDNNIDPFPERDEYSFILKEEPSDPITTENTSRYKVKKKKIKQRTPSLEFSDGTYRGSMDSDFTKNDEFDIYGKYIASQLRKMDLQRALRVQVEIHSLVSEARLSDLDNNR